MAELWFKTRTEAELVIDTITWTLPFSNTDLRDKNPLKVYTTRGRSITLDAKYQLKLNCLRDNLVELKFFTRHSLCLKAKLNILNSDDEFDEITETEYHNLRPNEWQTLSVLNKNTVWFSPTVKPELEIDLIVLKVISQDILEIKLAQDLKNLLNDGLFSDIVLICTDGVKYNAHKAVLSSRSAVFKAIFQENPTENVVDCPFDSYVFKNILFYIYCEKVSDVDKLPNKLLMAADYYHLDHLKSLCEFSLHAKLTVENAVETLMLANKYSAEILKLLTVEYINEGRISSVSKTAGWAELQDSALIKQIYELRCDEN